MRGVAANSRPSRGNTALAAAWSIVPAPTTATAARPAPASGTATSRQRPGCSGSWPGPCITLKRRTMWSPSLSQPAGAAPGPDPPSRWSRSCPGRRWCRRHRQRTRSWIRRRVTDTRSIRATRGGSPPGGDVEVGMLATDGTPDARLVPGRHGAPGGPRRRADAALRAMVALHPAGRGNLCGSIVPPWSPPADAGSRDRPRRRRRQPIRRRDARAVRAPGRRPDPPARSGPLPPPPSTA